MLLLAVATPGCKKKTAPPPPQVAPLPKKSQQAPTVTPANPVQTRATSARKPAVALPVQQQLSTGKRQQSPGAVSLDFTNRRDPFKSFVPAPVVQQQIAGKSARTKGRSPLPIQNFDTEKFKITGIITGLKQNSALVIDPTGKGYVIKEGMQIGNNDGYVKRVTTSSVEVEETFRDDNGRVRKRLVKLMLLRKK
jgi:type IV pilus assembly protein PilP